MKTVFPFLFLLALAAVRAADNSEPVAASDPEVSLVDCLRIAMDHNPQMRAASVQFLAVKGRAIKLHAILYPTGNIQALSTPMTFYVQVNQVLYSRATFPQLRISRLAEDQAVINYRQTLADIVYQVRQAFYNAMGAQKGVELVRAFAASQSHALSSAEQLFLAGKIQKSEVASIQVTDNLLTQRLARAQLAEAQARYALDNLLGKELPENVRLAGDLGVKIPGDLDVEMLTGEALRDRADLKLLESLHLSEKEQILVDLNNALPIVGFSSDSAFQPPTVGPVSNFDLERNYNEPEVQRQEGNSQLPVSLYMNWIVFDGGALEGVRMSDRAQLESQQMAVDALKHAIPGEVTAAVAAVQTEESDLKNFKMIPSPEEARHSAELDYQAGRIRQVDLVNFETDLLQQQQLYLAGRVRLALAAAALDHALGHGLLTKMDATGSLP